MRLTRATRLGLQFFRRIRDAGVSDSFGYAAARLYDSVRLRHLGLADAMHETRANLTTQELGYQSQDFHMHTATESYLLFRRTMDAWVRPSPSDVFIDIGSGLGRALLMAATYPFRKVIGIEYSPALCERSKSTIEQVRPRLQCQDVDVVNIDAAEYEIPDEVTVIYFWNPFGGRTLEAVVRNIKASIERTPRPVRLVSYAGGKIDTYVRDIDWIEPVAEVHTRLLPGVTSRVYSCH